jgi:hypothetical protein
MSFQCPQCLASSSLEINWSLSLQPDVSSDEICLQVIACAPSFPMIHFSAERNESVT